MTCVSITWEHQAALQLQSDLRHWTLWLQAAVLIALLVQCVPSKVENFLARNRWAFDP
jgi:hypothetical protein